MEISLDEFAVEYPNELEQGYHILETVGSGSFGTVIHAIENATNRECAIKIINKNNQKYSTIQKMKQEIQILKQLKHKNIVEFFGYSETTSKLYIIMEFIKYGTLKSWLSNHKENINEEEASTIITQLLNAVHYLHSHEIVHRDIKPENIMLSENNDLTSLKLIDFGLSALLVNEYQEREYCGTFLYMSPEQLEQKMYSKAVDLWSIGIIMYMLLNNGKHPFFNKRDRRLSYIEKIKETKIKLHNKCSAMAKLLLNKLLEVKPLSRYTVDKALKHPWITRNVNDKIPMMYNEVLKKQNLLDKFKDMFISVTYLNYFAKMNCNDNKTKKHKVFVVNKDYVNKVEMYSIMKKEQIDKIRQKGLDVISNVSSKNSNLSVSQDNNNNNNLPSDEPESKLSIINENNNNNNNNNVITSMIQNVTNTKTKYFLRKTTSNKPTINLNKLNESVKRFPPIKTTFNVINNNNSNSNNTYKNYNKLNVNTNPNIKLPIRKNERNHKKDNKSYLPLLNPLSVNTSNDFNNTKNQIKLIKSPFRLKQINNKSDLNMTEIITDLPITTNHSRNHKQTYTNNINKATSSTTTTNANTNKKQYNKVPSENKVSKQQTQTKKSNFANIPLILPTINVNKQGISRKNNY